jgi:ribosomal protein S18 acetylase RimI-like enzyme
MPEIEIRPAAASDLAVIAGFDHTYQTAYVWQMDRLIEDGHVGVNFREVRLPRSIHVDYPNPKIPGSEGSGAAPVILMALLNHEAVGYIGVRDDLRPETTWVSDLAVCPQVRRRGIGTALLLAAQEWGVHRKCRYIILEMQSKNHPAIKLAMKLGYEFCGYNDHYYLNQDIALFFTRYLR